MRGLRLFVRPIEPADEPDVNRFLESAGRGAQSAESRAQCGLLGKLLGEVVAVVRMDLAADAILISDLVVARDLRRKRIGRVMMREAEQFASKLERRMLIVENAAGAHEFLRRVGFEQEKGERWVRVVSS